MKRRCGVGRLGCEARSIKKPGPRERAGSFAFVGAGTGFLAVMVPTEMRGADQ